MRTDTIHKLEAEGLITGEQRAHLTRIYDRSLFSLYYELKTMLYFGVLFFTTGVGILVYQNIDSIGHQAIIGFLSLLTCVCFWHATRQKPPYSHAEVKSPGILYDYILLLGCLLFATVIGYVQYQYSIFGQQWGLSALVPALVFLFVAYSYDHRGVLSLGIAGLASWLGLSISPVELMKENIFATDPLIVTGLGFGAFICAAALILDRYGIKKHFTFTALNIGSHILFIACLAALFTFGQDWIYFILLVACCAAGIVYARREQSFMFLLISTVYGYIGLTYMFRDFFLAAFGLYFYFIASCGAIIYFVFNYKKFLGRP
ncbi:MAG: DUF2157 domain-containing protein [Bacteroidota bacterium]